MKSNRFQFNYTDLVAWLENAKWFMATPVIIYATSVLWVISQPNHIIAFVDFLPNNAVYITLVGYCLNRVVDYFRRYQSGK